MLHPDSASVEHIFPRQVELLHGIRRPARHIRAHIADINITIARRPAERLKNAAFQTIICIQNAFRRRILALSPDVSFLVQLILVHLLVSCQQQIIIRLLVHRSSLRAAKAEITGIVHKLFHFRLEALVRLLQALAQLLRACRQ